MEDMHPEGESPFIAKHDQEDEGPSSRFQAVEDNGYVECPISRCGEAIPVAELDSHLELHSTEEKEADSFVESTTSHDEMDGLEPSGPIFDTKLPAALRNLHDSSDYLSPSAERRAKAKDSWRGILNMPSSSLSQTPPNKGNNGRLGVSDLFISLLCAGLICARHPSLAPMPTRTKCQLGCISCCRRTGSQRQLISYCLVEE